MFQQPVDRVEDTPLTSRITAVALLNSLVLQQYWIWIRKNEDNNLEANKGKEKNRNCTWKVVILWEEVTRREERGPKSDYNSLRASLSLSLFLCLSRRVGEWVTLVWIAWALEAILYFDTASLLFFSFTVCFSFTKEILPAMLIAWRVGLAVKGLTLGVSHD